MGETYSINKTFLMGLLGQVQNVKKFAAPMYQLKWNIKYWNKERQLQKEYFIKEKECWILNFFSASEIFSFSLVTFNFPHFELHFLNNSKMSLTCNPQIKCRLWGNILNWVQIKRVHFPFKCPPPPHWCILDLQNTTMCCQLS